MEILIQFFQGNPTGIFILILTSVIGFVITATAGVIQVLSFRKQLDSEKDESDIRKILRTNLSAKKKEIDKIEAELNVIIENKTKLNEELKKEIPKRAKVLFLKDQIEMTKEKITEQFDIYNNLLAELNQLDSNVPSELILENEIVEKIRPFHVQKIKRDKLLRRVMMWGMSLLVLSVLPFIISLLLVETDLFGFTRQEYPLFRFFEVLLLMVSSYYILFIIKGKRLRRVKTTKLVRGTMNVIFLSLGLFSLLIFLLALSQGFPNSNYYYSLEKMIINELQILFGYMFLGLLISQAIMVVIYQSKMQSFTES